MDELIRKQDAINAIMGQPPEAHYPSWYAEQIKALPSAPQRTGHWISVFDEDEDKCSECQATFFCASTRFNFCPNCGARMEEEK